MTYTILFVFVLVLIIFVNKIIYRRVSKDKKPVDYKLEPSVSERKL